MARGSKGGAFLGLIFHHMKAADYCYQQGDGVGAVAHLEAAGSLVKAKLPPQPFIDTNPNYSPSLQQKFGLYYTRNLGTVARAVREFMDSHTKNGLDVDDGNDGDGWEDGE